MTRRVRVERLELRVRGMSPHAAREAAREFARELLEELARGGGGAAEGRAAAGRRNVRVERVEARVPEGESLTRGPEARASAARRVAGAVRSRTK